MFCDKFGWNFFYNWIISHDTKIGHVYINDKFQPYNRDNVYLMRLLMYFPFECENVISSEKKTN